MRNSPTYNKAYHAKHKEKLNAHGRELYHSEKEQRSMKMKEYYLEHKDEIIERVRENKSSVVLDPVKTKARQRRKNKAKKARKRDAFIEHVEDYIVFELSEGICGICMQPILEDFHVDHIIPLSRDGEHSYANVQAAHSSCNLKKGNTIIEGGLEGRALGSERLSLVI